MSSPNGSVYEVVVSWQARNKLKELHRRAKDKGHGTRVLTAAKRIIAHLRTEPLQFGEPRYMLHHLHLEMRVGGVSPLRVIYAVHQNRAIVFVRDFGPLPGSGF